jgi:hypothetical protein
LDEVKTESTPAGDRVTVAETIVKPMVPTVTKDELSPVTVTRLEVSHIAVAPTVNECDIQQVEYRTTDDVGTGSDRPYHPAEPVAEPVRDVTGNFQVGDRVLIKAGGCFDGKSATIFDCVSNSREIGVKLDQSEGGHILRFEAKYLVQVDVKM